MASAGGAYRVVDEDHGVEVERGEHKVQHGFAEELRTKVAKSDFVDVRLDQFRPLWIMSTLEKLICNLPFDF